MGKVGKGKVGKERGMGKVGKGKVGQERGMGKKKGKGER